MAVIPVYMIINFGNNYVEDNDYYDGDNNDN